MNGTEGLRKRRWPWGLASTAILGLCAVAFYQVNNRGARIQDAEDFRACFVAELERLSPGVGESVGEGDMAMGLRVIARDREYLLPREKLPPGKIVEVCDAALERWGKRSAFQGITTSHGSEEFNLSFGDYHSHMFLDVINIPKEDGMHVRLLMRGVE